MTESWWDQTITATGLRVGAEPEDSDGIRVSESVGGFGVQPDSQLLASFHALHANLRRLHCLRVVHERLPRPAVLSYGPGVSASPSQLQPECRAGGCEH
eukprot:3932217-Rhodomonas_salina.2